MLSFLKARVMANVFHRGVGAAIDALRRETPDLDHRVDMPADMDVKAIRAQLGLTQQDFAGRFGFSISAVRHWEQGRRIPTGASMSYLLAIRRDAKGVRKALRGV